MLRRIRAAATRAARPAPLWEAYGRLVEAEACRAGGEDLAGRWEEAVAALEPLERPYQLAFARYRLAEALLGPGADAAARDRAAGLLGRAHEAAERMGARPLRDDVALLARRARLPLGAGQPVADAVPEPAEDFGLTPRERDVLRLVAVGRSNRLIAQELFISPKTASVHVSNILAKLGVSGRGEAAAMAHRLRLFADEAGVAAG